MGIEYTIAVVHCLALHVENLAIFESAMDSRLAKQNLYYQPQRDYDWYGTVGLIQESALKRRLIITSIGFCQQVLRDYKPMCSEAQPVLLFPEATNFL